MTFSLNSISGASRWFNVGTDALSLTIRIARILRRQQPVDQAEYTAILLKSLKLTLNFTSIYLDMDLQEKLLLAENKSVIDRLKDIDDARQYSIWSDGTIDPEREAIWDELVESLGMVNNQYQGGYRMLAMIETGGTISDIGDYAWESNHEQGRMTKLILGIWLRASRVLNSVSRVESDLLLRANANLSKVCDVSIMLNKIARCGYYGVTFIITNRDQIQRQIGYARTRLENSCTIL